MRADWPAPRGVRAAFTLRGGGVSEAPFDTLNLALHTGDVPEAVTENRRRVRRALELPAEPVWLEQVHGAQVLRLGAAGTAGADTEARRSERGRRAEAPQLAPPSADATVTCEPGQVCAIQVADCIPVLLAARDGSAVGAAHAGWRGLASGVIEAAVEALRGLTTAPSEIIAWLGPGIGPAHFEVGGEVRAAFEPGAHAAFTRNARGRWQCDLPALARGRLKALGVREIHGGSWCTYGDPGRFFSYRRDGRCGRMAALIWREV